MNAYSSFTVFFSILSMLVSLISIIVHISIRKMLRHPGEFIMIQCVAQLFLDIHWLEVLDSFWEFLIAHPAACKWMAICDIIASALSMNYMLCLSVEVIVRISKKTNPFHQIRKYSYHIFSIGQAIFLVVLAEANKDFGSSDIGTCSLIPNSLTESIRLYTFAGETFIMWVLIILMIRKVGKTYSNVLFNYFLVVLTMTFSVTVVNILGYADDFKLKNPQIYSNLALAIGSTTGISVGLSRLMNKRLIKEFLWKFGIKLRFKRKNVESMYSKNDSFLSGNIYNFGDLFENFTKKYFISILAIVCLRFEKHDKSYLVVENEIGFDHYEFDESLFDDMSLNCDMPRIKDIYHPDMYLIEYKPELFGKIRAKNCIPDEIIYKSFSIPRNLENLKNIQSSKGGRSGSPVFFTFNQEFVIKPIKSSERKLLLSMLSDYSNRISYSNSRLVRIIGLFKIQPENQDFIIMENIISSPKDAIIFDLKGSNIDRFVQEELTYNIAYGKVLKDLNFASSGLKLNFSNEIREELIESLKLDFKVLAKHNIMDYSVLLAFFKESVEAGTRYDIKGNDRVYALGIIDFLQSFNIKKKTEKYIKKIVYREGEISTEVPELYMNRLTVSISSIIKGGEDIQMDSFGDLVKWK